jgi:DNA-binding SARP family transcriptional activator/nucleotide-binding universal stress UspA family protein
VGVLGPVELRRGGVPVKVGAAKQRTILALLALHSGETVSTDHLLDALWGTDPPRRAAKALQVYVSELRKLVEPKRGTAGVIVSQPPGYALVVPPDAIDVRVFERLWSFGREQLAAGDARSAASTLEDALALWRGAPLADMTYEPAFSGDIARLEEMRSACLEDRIEADLAAGRHASVIPELEQLVRSNPLRERPCAQLMLALYRSGRQSEALATYRRARTVLVDELGLGPSPGLVELERRVLQHDPDLDLPGDPRHVGGNAAPRSSERAIFVVGEREQTDLPAEIGAQLARSAGLGLVLLSVLGEAHGPGPDPLREATHRLSKQREALVADGLAVRIAALPAADPAEAVLKLATLHETALILIDGTPTLTERPGLAHSLMISAPCDVALFFPGNETRPGGAILVPFGGDEHDWAALELAAQLARATEAPLLIAGADAEGGSEAGRLLAAASLILQRTMGVTPEPALTAPGAEGVLRRAADAAVVVLGASRRYGSERLGETRETIVRNAVVPVLVLRRGSRPGVLAPPEAVTRFAWSLAESRV